MISAYENVAVIGAGTMGNGIAHVFAQSGYDVHLVDQSPEALEKALKTIEKNMDRQVKKEKITEADKKAALARIKTTSDLSQAVADRKLVVEVVSESKELKDKIFADLDAHAPADAILASNTSSISITRIASATQRADKVIGMHFMNPVPVMKLIEIIKGYDTSQETLDTILEISRDLGKTPVPANDYPGFVANRILMPMINEAIYTLWQGVATAENIDEVMKLGMAHPMGPLTLADFIGLDVCLSILQVLHEGFGDPKYAPCPLLVNMVQAGHLGRKSGRGFYDYSK